MTNIISGTGQGNIQGPPIFDVCLNLAAQLTEDNKVLSHGSVLQRAITSSGEDTVILDLDYTDNIVFFDNCKVGLQESTNLLSSMLVSF